MRNLLCVCAVLGVVGLLAGCQQKAASVEEATITDTTLASVQPPTVNIDASDAAPLPPTGYSSQTPPTVPLGPSAGNETVVETVVVEPSPPAGSPPMNYTVARGDTLFSISRRFYGDGSMAKAIFEANRNVLASPDVIKVGQTLMLPAKGAAPTVTSVPHAAPAAPAAMMPVSTAPPAPATYTVRKGDSLFVIAKRIYGKGSLWTKIYEANRDKIQNPDRVREGTVLTIPS